MGGSEGSTSVSGSMGGQTSADVTGGDHSNMMGVFNMLGQMVAPMATGMAATDPNMIMMSQMNFNTEVSVKSGVLERAKHFLLLQVIFGWKI